MAKKKPEYDDNKLMAEMVEYAKKNKKKLPKDTKIENGQLVYYEPADFLGGGKKKKKK